MSNPASALDTVMEEAEAAAANLAPPVPALGNATGLAPAVPANLNRPSLESFIESGGMDVDEYLKVVTEGIRIGGKMQGLLEEVIVEIDLTEVAPIVQSRHESGGKTTFLKSYDGATTPDGKSFDVEFQRLSRLNVKTDGPFQTCEIPMTLVDDVEDPKKGSSLSFAAGTRIGLTPSKTGAKEFQRFMKKLRAQDPNAIYDTVKVRLTHQKRTNSNNNEWGVVEFAIAD